MSKQSKIIRIIVSSIVEPAVQMGCNGDIYQNTFDNGNADKKQVIYIKQWNIYRFFLIIDNELEDFLEYDHCSILADNYLIAMVFTYFLRAQFAPSEYTPYNFFIALYLANIMEEDDDVTYVDLQTWAISKATDSEVSKVVKSRDKLFKRMDYRCAVSRSCCELVMQYAKPEHKICQRKRHVNHSGAISEHYRKINQCPSCSILNNSTSSDDSDKMSDSSKSEGIAVHKLKKFKRTL